MIDPAAQPSTRALDGRPVDLSTIPSIEVQIDGAPGQVSLEEFLRVLGNASQILRGVDAVVTARPHGAVRWFISDLRMGSVVARLSPEARPGANLRVVDEVVAIARQAG